MEEMIDLEGLTEEEKTLILSVIKRDEELRKEQDTRASQLRSEIHNLRLQSVIRDGDDLSKICARCHKPFGFFFNTGDICSQCKFRVCGVCRESLLTGKWLCTLCYKQVQLKGLTGEWIQDNMNNEKQRLSQSGADLVKASLKHSLSNGTVSKARDGDGGDGDPETKRGVTRQNSASREDLDRVGYPQNADKKRLSNLFDTFRSSKDVPDNEHDIKHVSCRRRNVSDSDSGSSSDEETPMDVGNSKTHSSDQMSSTSAAILARNLSETESASDLHRDQKESPEIKVPNGETNNKETSEAAEAASTEHSRNSMSPEKPQMTPTEAVILSKRLSGPQDQLMVSQPSSSNSPVSPVHNTSHSLEHKPMIVRRTSSEKSDTSSMSSARTASPATKMRLLDMASKRALERESFDQEESGHDSPRHKPEDTPSNGVNRLRPQQSRTTSGTSSPGRHVGVNPPVMSDRTSETESHGDDSGHISGTSAENTPEHKSRHHSHLSIPSLVLTSTSAEEPQDREEEDEDIDDLVATHKSLGSLRGSRGNLYSSLTRSSTLSSDSRESLYSVYSDAGEINFGKIPATGEILFGLDYNYKTGALEIHVKQCKDIAPVDTKRNRSDPYVKTYLLPDKTRSGKRKTKIKKHTLNPTFDEVLRYVISKSEVENRVLWVTVWHHDRFGRNDFLGEVMIPMDCYKFGDASPKWYPLQDRLEAPDAQPVSYKGDLVLSIKFVTADNLENDGSRRGKSKKGKAPPRGELQVLVKEAKNLTAVRSNGSSDPFCKAYLLPEKHKSSKQKSAVVKRNCNPTWNHVFLFEDVSQEEMKDRSLELTIWDYDKITSNDFLGGVRLNLGTGVSSGKTVEWMDARGEEIAIWQSCMDRPNCWNDGTIGLRATMGKSEIRK